MKKITKKVCLLSDEVTKIKYKVIHVMPKDTYEIYTQYKDESNKLLRRKILDEEVVAVEKDKDKVISYVRDVLIAEHRNMYKDGNVKHYSTKNTATRLEPLPEDAPGDEQMKHARELTLEELKHVAIKCANYKEISVEKGMGRYRSIYIAEYAKKKANGRCQLCGMPAPFSDNNGEPYLESHHVKWLSKGGEDSIDNVVALCPNCHRKMHVVNDVDEVEKLKCIAKNCWRH